jgi:hypothetical protein
MHEAQRGRREGEPLAFTSEETSSSTRWHEFEELQERETRAVKLFMQEREVEKTSATPLEKRIGVSATPR